MAAGTSGPSTARRRAKAFLAFWYDFVVGDDWFVAAGVAAGLGLTFALSRTAVPVWWLMPLTVGILLPVSLWRHTDRR